MIQNGFETDFGMDRIRLYWIPFRNYCQGQPDDGFARIEVLDQNFLLN